ncbi:MAG: pilus assembly protein PilP [Bdellovibrionota bacterium]
MKLFIFLLFISIGALAAPPKNPLDEFFKDKTRIENPLELRDPFKSPQSKGASKRQGGNRFRRGENAYSNLAQDNLRDWNIYELRVQGVMIGKERRAMISRGGEGAVQKVVVIKEGSLIGPDNAEVKAILPGGIILVEKIINVYGQEEYLETVVPISR